jgi:hypothetical protein
MTGTLGSLAEPVPVAFQSVKLLVGYYRRVDCDAVLATVQVLATLTMAPRPSLLPGLLTVLILLAGEFTCAPTYMVAKTPPGLFLRPQPVFSSQSSPRTTVSLTDAQLREMQDILLPARPPAPMRGSCAVHRRHLRRPTARAWKTASSGL